MPLVAAAAIGVAGAIASAKVNSNASKRAATMQTDAANHAADVQGRSNTEAIDFQKQQAAEDKRRYDEAQQRNYEQYLRRYHGAQALGQSIGFQLPDAPDYFSQTPQGAPPTGVAPSGPIPNAPSDPAQLEPFIKAQLASTGGDPNTSGYWMGKWGELNARGQQLNDPQYAVKRLLGWQAGAADRPKAGPYAGAPAAGGSAMSPMGSSSVAAYLDPRLGGGMPPPVAAPQMRGISSYL